MNKHFLLTVFLFICLVYFPVVLTNADDKAIRIHPEETKKTAISSADLKEKAQSYNRKAIALFEVGRYQEAQELWGKAIELIEHPGLQDLVDFETPVEDEQPDAESIAVEEPEGVDPFSERYQEGLTLLEQKQYARARQIFEAIVAGDPAYKNAQKYLMAIDELSREQSLPAGPAEIVESESPAGTIEVPPGADQAALPKEESQWEEAVAAAEQKLQAQLQERVQPIYARALQQYNDKQYQDAKNSFREVQAVLPGYKLTERYLEGIDEDILRAEQQREEEQRLDEERARRQDELEFEKIIKAREQAYRQELMARTEQLYQHAIEDFKNGRLEDAEDNFRKVETLERDYKLTGKFLERIERTREELERQQKEEDLRREALARQKEQEELKQTIAESERLRRQELKTEVESIYQKGRSYYAQGDLEKAKFNFEEVEKISPDYRSARKYLTRIEDDIVQEERRKLEKERWPQPSPRAEEIRETTTKAVSLPPRQKRLEAQRYYEEAKDAYRNREFSKAKEFFERVNALVGSYQATEKFLARIDEDIKAEEQYRQELEHRAARRQAREQQFSVPKGQALKTAAAKRRQESKELSATLARIKENRRQAVNRKVAELYRRAQTDYKKGLYDTARAQLQEVQEISPGYKATARYLEKIEVQLTRQQQRRLEEQEQALVRAMRQEAATKAAEPPATEPAVVLPSVPEVPPATLKEQARPKAEPKKAERLRQRQEREDTRRTAREKAQQRIEEKRKAAAAKAAAKKELFVKKVEKAGQKRLLAQVEKKYAGALAAYTSGDFQVAKKNFMEVEALWPNFKETGAYLSRIDTDIATQKQKSLEVLAPPVEVGPSRAYRVKTDRIFLRQQRKEEQARRKEQARIAREAAREEKLRQREAQKRQAQTPQLVVAPPKPETLVVMKPEQGRGIDVPQSPKQVKSVRAVKVPKTQPAKASVVWPFKPLQPAQLDAVVADDPVQIQKQQAQIQKERRNIQVAIQTRLDQSYREAVDLYANGHYLEARNLFAQIATVEPSFKGTANYLAMINQKLRTTLSSGSGIKAPPVFVNPRVQTITDMLDTLERPAQ